MSSILFMTKQASPLPLTLYYLKILRIVIIRRHEKILRIHYPDDNRDERLCNPARYHSASCFHALICTPCLSRHFSIQNLPHTSMHIPVTGEPVLAYFPTRQTVQSASPGTIFSAGNSKASSLSCHCHLPPPMALCKFRHSYSSSSSFFMFLILTHKEHLV